VAGPIAGSVPVLVVGAGARWEPAALESLDAAPGVVVLRRCMDVTDLLAHAAAGDARVAVIAAEAPGLDVDAIAHLARSGVLPLVVLPEELDGAAERVRRLGVRSMLGDRHLAELPAAVLALSRSHDDVLEQPERTASTGAGRVITVWGPAGAPGRTTVSLGLAGELASRGANPLLMDLDPWGGAIAQRLGVLDEVSGLLAAARLSGRPDLAERFTSLQRQVAGFRVLTGLPRADRWLEVRGDVVDELVDLGTAEGDVVLDTGFSLEDDPMSDLGGRPTRNGLTLAAISVADDLVVVGTADPVGLSRLARGLSELGETTGGRPVHVVLNRWRSRLGLDEAEVRRLLSGYGDLLALHVVPEDGLAADRALVTGRTFAEGATSPLARSFVPLVDLLFPGRVVQTAPPRRLRGRTAARARRP
jgi:MinD-like ATPase involved in chromosome partitioning or flagellar assembly